MSDEPDIRVVVADDQTVVREGLVGMLGLVLDIEVVGAAGNGQEAIELALRHDADVVLMDLRMPELDGAAATRRLRDARPTVGVLVLTTYSDDQSIAEALAAGAAGYLTKDATAEAIAHAVRVVYAGGQLLDPQVHARLVESISSRTVPPPSRDIDPGLTTREVEVLRLIAQGWSNAELAERLHVSPATVKTHINNLFAKLGVRDRAQAVAFAYNNGFAEPSPPTG